MHFQMAAMYILKGTIKCNVINHGIAHMQNLGYYYQYKIDVYNNSSKYFAI